MVVSTASAKTCLQMKDWLSRDVPNGKKYEAQVVFSMDIALLTMIFCNDTDHHKVLVLPKNEDSFQISRDLGSLQSSPMILSMHINSLKLIL